MDRILENMNITTKNQRHKIRVLLPFERLVD